jgi:hypothetical protein
VSDPAARVGRRPDTRPTADLLIFERSGLADAYRAIRAGAEEIAKAADKPRTKSPTDGPHGGRRPA